jgi:putative NADH-flavin reductase
MKLIVFGPTGGTGEQLIRQALASGHQVTAVARRPEAVTLTHVNLEVRPGDVLDPAWPGTGLTGAEAVLSALGSHARQPTTLYSAGTSAILAAMGEAGISRFIGITATPVGPESQKPPLDRYVAHPILQMFFGHGYADMKKMEELLAFSPADWTVFRPPRLTNGPLSPGYRTAVDAPLKGARTISRASLAAAMLAAISDTALFRHAVTIAN